SAARCSARWRRPRSSFGGTSSRTSSRSWVPWTCASGRWTSERALIPNLFAVCKVLVAAIIGIVQSIIYALSGPIPPLRGLGDWLGLDAVITVVAYLIVATVVVLWVTVLNLFAVMWVERKLYSRLQDRYGIMISIWSLPFWPFNR